MLRGPARVSRRAVVLCLELVGRDGERHVLRAHIGDLAAGHPPTCVAPRGGKDVEWSLKL